jgi:hypothetical protein
MIRTSTQVMLEDGFQSLTFKTTTSPTQALIEWDGGSTTVDVNYEESEEVYSCIVLVPADTFTVKLDTEERKVRYKSDYGSDDAKNIVELETDEYYWLLKVPYCDLATVDLRFYNNLMQPLEVWASLDSIQGKRAWWTYKISVQEAYGAPSLISVLELNVTAQARIQNSPNWSQLNEVPGGVIVEVINHSRITTDKAVNATVCRDELYGKTYRKTLWNY